VTTVISEPDKSAIIPIVPLDLEKTPLPWKNEFQQVTHPDLLGMAAIEGEVDALYYGAYYHMAKILHWVIKLKWDSQHKLPKLPRGQQKAYKPLGKLYVVVINLCQECHFWGYGKQYNNAAEWFAMVLTENALDCPNVDQSKDADIKQMQRQNKQLFSELENPFSPVEEPATYELIEAAIAICGKSDVLRKTIWKRLKEARLEWLNEYRTGVWRSPRRIIENNEDKSPKLNKDGFPIIEKAFIQVGKGGNQTQTLPPLFLGSVEPLSSKDFSPNTSVVGDG
jgi:hypothetical protein